MSLCIMSFQERFDNSYQVASSESWATFQRTGRIKVDWLGCIIKSYV